MGGGAGKGERRKRTPDFAPLLLRHVQIYYEANARLAATPPPIKKQRPKSEDFTVRLQDSPDFMKMAVKEKEARGRIKTHTRM